MRQFASVLLKEGLDPARAGRRGVRGNLRRDRAHLRVSTSCRLWVWRFSFKLNKPLTVASTFINNPLLQPLIVVSSVEIGYFLRGGSFRPFHMSALAGPHVKEELLAWVMGSVVLGVLVGGGGGLIAAVVVLVKAPANPELRERIRLVNQMFAQCPRADRGFVRWKLRLDRIFGLLAVEDLRIGGTVVDLGCGYGMALSFAAFGDETAAPDWLRSGRASHRRRPPGPQHAERGFECGGCSRFQLPFDLSPIGLILILDVLQYLPAEEQLALLQRCCSALAPRGMLIFRVHDRERGWLSTITMAFDRVLFACGRAGTRPLMLSAAEYHGALESAGMQVEERRFRNLLPLAHILFIAKKSVGEDAAEVTV